MAGKQAAGVRGGRQEQEAGGGMWEVEGRYCPALFMLQVVLVLVLEFFS
jgi:hypothetical protein